MVSSEFNSYFCGIAGKVRSKIPETKSSYKDYFPNPYQRSFFCRPTNTEVIKRAINSLVRSKSTGLYSIPFRILNILNEELANILSKIFNLSINKGKFIDVLKIVKVVPVFKNKGSPLETGNYRPIFLLSNVDKIYEKICLLYTSDAADE